MLPLILAAASMLSSSAGTAAAQSATKEGARAQMKINQQSIDKRREIQDDLTLRNKPYYDQGIAQLPGILAMSSNPDFSPTDAKYGDKYSLGANQMRLSSMARQGRNLVAPSELDANFNMSEQARLLNRKQDMLKVGYGQAGTAGQSLMTTGNAVADIGQRIGNTQANALSLASIGRQQNVINTMDGASYAPLYMNYKRMNQGAKSQVSTPEPRKESDYEWYLRVGQYT